jgi:hypothetical protein
VGKATKTLINYIKNYKKESGGGGGGGGGILKRKLCQHYCIWIQLAFLNCKTYFKIKNQNGESDLKTPSIFTPYSTLILSQYSHCLTLGYFTLQWENPSTMPLNGW